MPVVFLLASITYVYMVLHLNYAKFPHFLNTLIYIYIALFELRLVYNCLIDINTIIKYLVNIICNQDLKDKVI